MIEFRPETTMAMKIVTREATRAREGFWAPRRSRRESGQTGSISSGEIGLTADADGGCDAQGVLVLVEETGRGDCQEGELADRASEK